MLLARFVSKSYGQLSVIDKFSYEFVDGRYIIKGKNGVGKTTLMYMLAGAVIPDSGAITFHNNDITTNLCSYKKHIGFSPSSFNFYPHLTGSEILSLVTEIKNNKAHRYIQQLVTEFGLERFLTQKSGKMSYGTLKKLSICVSLIGCPSIVFWDEPLNGLDDAAVVTVRRLADDLTERILIVSSHQNVFDSTDASRNIELR